MEEEIKRCVDLLLDGKVILYPTDTVWGIGCDATNEAAVRRIFEIKERQESKSMLVLLDLLQMVERPTTFVYPYAFNLPDIMIPSDGTLAIRVVHDCFCRKLIKALNRPLVSTSANISGQHAPAVFSEISPVIRERVDYIVPESYTDSTDFKPSRMIKFVDDYNFTVIRE